MLQLFSFAQTSQSKDSIQQLEEVTITGIKLRDFSSGLNIYNFKKVELEKNTKSLGNFLQENTSIYLKSYSNSMLSSISFRGTSSSQTSVVWNGIPINSFMNGQTDFNTVFTNSIDQISVREGGGSVIYGSGAIGGTILLENTFAFYDKFKNQISATVGSFDTYKTRYQLDFATEKFAIKFSANAFKSENDYKFLGTSKKNNGSYEGLNIGLNVATKINSKNTLKFYSLGNLLDRNLSSTLFNKARDKQKDENLRTLLEWNFISEKSNSNLKFGFIQDLYQYFSNRENENHDFGKGRTFISKYDFIHKVSEKIKAGIGVEYTKNWSDGTVESHQRNTYASYFLFRHYLTNKFDYGVNIRKEWTKSYEVPFVYAIDFSYQILPFYTIKSSASTNFRTPTFNDLYWPNQGNPDLKPEDSKQIEIGNYFQFKNFHFNLTTYLIQSKNMIQWKPTGNVWKPINVAEMKGHGIQFSGMYKYTFGNHQFKLNTNFSYTVSKDAELDTQLMYVPLFKTTESFTYSYKSFSFNYQFLWTDSVKNLTNSDQKIDSFNVSNISFFYNFLLQKNSLDIGLEMDNIYNTPYTVVYNRPMPNRNFQLTLTYKF